MDLVRHPTSAGLLSIHSIGAEGIRIGDQCYQQTLLLTGSEVMLLPQVKCLADITNPLIESALLSNPDVVLIGTGDTLLRPSRKQYLDWLNAGVGVEPMDTHAASRTFNILLSEARLVAAILIPPACN
ncbi:MAG: Mth938-like domain-containing protein [Xanthomonadales bacterium]|nr:Mth938-like domain-containing protein [Xanthomonadales bacterium]